MADIAALEAAYLAARDTCSTEYMRFAATTSPRYSPARLCELSAAEARARRAWLDAKYGRMK